MPNLKLLLILVAAALMFVLGGYGAVHIHVISGKAVQAKVEYVDTKIGDTLGGIRIKDFTSGTENFAPE